MIDDAKLDMLVDGELSEAERRDVLSRLDAEPDGWRRCALAFLEGQSWRDAMRSISDDSLEAVAVSGSRRSWRRFRALLATACSLLLALGVGFAVGGLFARNPMLAPPEHVAEGPEVKESLDAQPAEEPAEEVISEPDVPIQYVAIPSRDPVSGNADSIQMPVVPQEYLDEGWPYRLPAVVPESVVKTLRRRGREVVQQRRLVPFQAADGSRVVFPVDEVELLPVKNRGYQ